MQGAHTHEVNNALKRMPRTQRTCKKRAQHKIETEAAQNDGSREKNISSLSSDRPESGHGIFLHDALHSHARILLQ